MTSATERIQQLSLVRHPEGGYYTRIYESLTTLQTQKGVRTASSAIHYLLEQNDFSSWHRISHDEIWFFHEGLPLTIHELTNNGDLKSSILSHHHNLSITIKGNTWFRAEAKSHHFKGQYSLVSCVVSPGFDFLDFEIGKEQNLLTEYPQHKDIIKRLCRE